MAFQQIPLNNSKLLALWVNETEAIAYNHKSKSLTALEPLNVSLLLSIDEGLEKARIVEQLVNESNLDESVVLAAYEKMQAVFSGSKSKRAYKDGQYPEIHKAPRNARTDSLIIQVGKTVFAIECDNPYLTKQLDTLFQPINVQTAKQPDFILTIRATDPEISADNLSNGAPRECVLLANDIVVENVPTMSHLVPVLIDRLQILAYQNTDYHMVFHGAALSRYDDNECKTILLPGVSGAGKSTLAAELNRQGFQLHSDEIIVFDKRFNISTIQLPIAIKSGSWPIMSQHYPALHLSDEWLRVDGRRLKYVWPTSFAQSDAGENRTVYIVCPYYDAQQPANKQLLITTDVLGIMTQGGYQLGHELSAQSSKQLIDFFDQLPSWSIHYDSSDRALAFVEEICQR